MGLTSRPMEVLLLAFAQAHEQLGFRERTVACEPEETPRQLLARVAPQFNPSSARVALDCQYGDWDGAIGPAREIAVIPPVSGG